MIVSTGGVFGRVYGAHCAERWQDCRTRYDYVFCDTAQCSRMCAAAGCTLKLDLDRAALTDFKHRTVDTRAVSMHVTIEVASWTRCPYLDARWTIGIGCAVAAPCTRRKPNRNCWWCALLFSQAALSRDHCTVGAGRMQKSMYAPKARVHGCANGGAQLVGAERRLQPLCLSQ